MNAENRPREAAIGWKIAKLKVSGTAIAVGIKKENNHEFFNVRSLLLPVVRYLGRYRIGIALGVSQIIQNTKEVWDEIRALL